VEEEEFIARFEAGTLSGENFRHCDHIRMAWLYLARYPVLDALTRFSDGLRQFAAAHGKPQLYHQTITWSYVFLIHERRERCAPGRTWEEFADANADLFERQNGILRLYYEQETLDSDFARKVFVFPDKAVRPLPGARALSSS
jgi:hypothetical protein